MDSELFFGTDENVELVFVRAPYCHTLHAGGNLSFKWDSDTPAPSRWCRF